MQKVYNNIKPVLPYLEFHVCDHCNLNCKGCGHFSSLVSEPRFSSIRQFKNDINRLAELFSNIKVIRLLGGEPLLNPKISEFILSIRNVFPFSKVIIVTNGLIIPKMPKELFVTMRHAEVSFMISLYPPTIKMLDLIKSVLTRERIEYSCTKEITKFVKFLNNKPNDTTRETIYNQCISKNCTFLQNGKLSVCDFPFHIEEFNSRFGLNYKVEEGDFFDIYQIKDGNELNDMLNKPIPFCKYCSEKPEYINWSVLDREVRKEDWITNDDVC